MTTSKKPAVVIRGPELADLANRIAGAIGAEIHVRRQKSDDETGPPQPVERVFFSDIVGHLRALFRDGRPIIGLFASGILLRSLGSILDDKTKEPPVLAVSEDGGSIVPLLGGHSGANALAKSIAAETGGHAAITTTGDLRFGVALDAPPKGWTLCNPDDAKTVMAKLVRGASVELEGESAPWLTQSSLPFSEQGDVRLTVGITEQGPRPDTLNFAPHRLALGVGCERDCDPTELSDLVFATMQSAGFSPDAIAVVTSIDVKADEPALHQLSIRLNRPARFFSAEELEAQTPRLANPSEIVFREVGTHGVAEAAALAAAGSKAELVVAKKKSKRATCAVALSPSTLDPERIGRARGRLAIVGIGPGSPDWLTPEARRYLETSDAVVGYGLYLDLVAPLIETSEQIRFDLGQEEARALKALELSGRGRNVALISSGDAGIYGIATLVFEALDRADLPDAAKRIELRVCPGLTAMQAAAARAGAPLGHDFCAISLSDLLTPWSTIRERVRAAAQSDFVVSFYNPISKRRRTQLAEAKAILLEHRPAGTPVVLARNLGRDGETVKHTCLCDVCVEDVDMLTIVVVGASTSRTISLGGKNFTYTPRGYELAQSASLTNQQRSTG